MHLMCTHPYARREVSVAGGVEEGLGNWTTLQSWAVRRNCSEVDSTTLAARRRASEVDSVAVELDSTAEEGLWLWRGGGSSGREG
jgi:hypothetical protein